MACEDVNLEELFQQMDSLRVECCDSKVTTERNNPHYCYKCDVETLKDDAYGIIVCTNCGVVQEVSIIDDSAEWNYSNGADGQKDPSRCGAPTNPFFEKSSMSTMIQGGNKNSLMQRMHSQMSMDYVERARWHIFEHINKIAADRGGLNQVVVNQAKNFYIKLNQRKLSRGNIRKGLIAACIFNACKECNVSRSVKEIADMCEIDISCLNKAIKIFDEFMKDETSGTKTTSALDLVHRQLNNIQIVRPQSFRISKRVGEMLDTLEDSGILHGKTPSAVSCALIFIAMNELQMQPDIKDISKRNKVSVVTMNKIINLVQETLPLT